MQYTLLDSDTITAPNGATLRRIQYTDGTLGGYLESGRNLDPNSDARVCGDAQVYGDARVYEPAHCLTIGPLGSRAAVLTICRDKNLGVSYATGCFFGSRDAFLAAVEATHGNTPHGNAYAAAVLLADHVVPAFTSGE